MIGALQQAITSTGGGEPPTNDLSMFITPSRGEYTSTNGSYTTPFYTANVSGGTEPYTFAWSSPELNVSLLTPSDDKTRARISGYNEFQIFQVTCTVTDAESNSVSSTAVTTITFGTGEAILP